MVDIHQVIVITNRDSITVLVIHWMGCIVTIIDRWCHRNPHQAVANEFTEVITVIASKDTVAIHVIYNWVDIIAIDTQFLGDLDKFLQRQPG